MVTDARIFLNRLSLRIRLILIILSMLAATLAATYFSSSRLERASLDEVQGHVETLCKAIEVSVQQLNVRGKSAEEVLKDYQSRLESKGVEEITLLTAEHRVLASTHSSRHQEDPSETGISSYHQEADLHESYSLTIPIVAEENLLGYVHLNLILSNFKALFRDLLYARMLLSVAVFGLGMVVVLPLVSYVTRPVKDLIDASHQVSRGNFDVALPHRSSADLAPLVSSFQQMAAQLKQQKKLEAQLAENEQAAAVGRVASGIAHDIRNPLNFVSLAVEHVQHKLDSKAAGYAEVGKLLEGARTELTRASEMIQDFLELGRPGASRLQEEDAWDLLLQSVQDVQRRHPGEESRIRLENRSSYVLIRVGRELLKRALVNLLENGLDAGGPKAVVTAGLRIEGDGAGPAVFWVQDQGPGFAPENLEKIFTPYFTTKQSGIGLGLALAHKWVREMGGTLRAGTTPEGGARFEVSFPTSR